VASLVDHDQERKAENRNQNAHGRSSQCLACRPADSGGRATEASPAMGGHAGFAGVAV
jgi:hypothetical protein